MTRTEERLADALAARAAAVREDSLRPLVAGALGYSGAVQVGGCWERRGWQARLAPIAAGVAMLLVIGGTIFAVSEFQGATSAPFADVGTAHAPPPYYVELDANHTLIVRATGTGLLTDQLPAPDPWGGSAMRLETALAAAANGSTFVVIYNNSGTGMGPYHTAIYTFTLTSAGHIADFRQVKDGVMPGLARISAAVSPDGSRVAIAGVPQRTAEAAGYLIPPPRIVVVNLRTGRRVAFQGGMGRRGQDFGINDVAWTSDGQSVVYLAEWCKQLDIQFAIGCYTGSVTEVRMISAMDVGGPLNGGRTVLRDSRAYPSILQALVSPDGRSIVAMTERRREISLVRFDLRTGTPIAVLYRRHAVLEPKGYGPGPSNAFLSSDGTGQYLILDEDLGAVDGWVHDGRFHPMNLGLPTLGPDDPWGESLAW